MYETLMEFVQPEIDKIVDEREKKAKNAMIQRMIAKGKLTLEEIAEYSDLPIKDVQELAGIHMEQLERRVADIRSGKARC